MAEFKVGDRVVAAEECTPYYPAGALGTVVASYDYDGGRSDYRVEFDAADGVHTVADGRRIWWVTKLVAASMTCKVSAHKAEYRARANDPATSKQAGKRVNKYEQAVLDLLRGLYAWQGYTGKQIASLTGHPLNCITPRFAPLRRKGLIKDSGQRRDKQIVWVLA